MNFVKIEATGKKIFAKFPRTRRFLKGIYQRCMYLISNEKIKSEGELIRISPDDAEYFFGYYDKSPWDITDRYMISLKVKNAYKVPDSCEEAEIVVFDTLNENRVEIIGTTHCWNSQQGCMAQWLAPDFKFKIIYNDCRNGKYVSVVYNFKTKKEEKVYDMPIYDVDKNGKFALSLDFSRLHRLRKGYGYANLEEETKKELCPNKSCIWKIDLETGNISEVLKYTDLASFEIRDEMKGAEHKVNHIMISPNGKRFMVLHRWFKNNEKFTRLVTMNIDGTDMYNLSDDNFVSHCCWKNDNEILSFLRKKETGDHYYLMKDKTKEYKMLWSELNTDGHCTYSPDGKYVITDTYPNRKRLASVYLCNENDKTCYRLVRVLSPFRYDNDTRCDLHPRWNHKGDKICIDSVHDGSKQLYILNLSSEKNKNSKNPLVSVIVPCYNSEKYLKYTLESLEKQLYKNIEIICVNDGSTDKTSIILDNWSKTTKTKHKIITQENLGVSHARNVGLANAHGKYIMFLDADDLYKKEMILYLVNEMELKKVDAAYCNLKKKYEDVFENNNIAIIHDQQQSEAMKNLLYNMSEISFDCYIYLSKKIKELNLYFDENTKYGEDREFNWKYLCHCKKISFIQFPMYYYRINDESATRKVPTWSKTDLLAAIKRTENYLSDNNCQFYEEFKSYMYSRAVWTVAKTFATGRQKKLYKRFIKEYDVKKHMKRMLGDKSKIVVIGSFLYLIHQDIFYLVLSRISKKERVK